MQNKYMSMLGLARRAGRLAMGHDMALDSIRRKKAKLLLFTSDASPRLKEEFSRASERFLPQLLCVTVSETMDDIHRAAGYRAGVMCVTDIHFADRIIELIDREENDYGDKN